MFVPSQGQTPFLTVKTDDSGLKKKNMLKLDEKLDQKTGVQNTRPRQGVLSPVFWAMFGPAQGQTPFLTVKTADSGLENKKYSETRRKVGSENRGSNWTPDHGKGSLAPVQDKGT